ncbi:MAG: dTDP-4-dehydrorhamnose 3,5-epimerase [Chloroflexi bacterium]|nr:dTDP-4-dehydrorhamnose 3,5-epimerase [Chloroflexota bacterium]
MFEAQATVIPGCFVLKPTLLSDHRGRFVKTFHAGHFKDLGLVCDFKEQYYSTSDAKVLRGLHFQGPPYEYDKLVFCVSGSVFDTVVDLRVGSPAYGKYVVTELSSDLGNEIYIPHGLAHGFYVLSETATLLYNVTTVYHPSHDMGIRWDSLAIPWPDREPTISERDARLPLFSGFASPFRYDR